MAGSGDTVDRVEGRGGKEERAREEGESERGFCLCVCRVSSQLYGTVSRKNIFELCPGISHR